MANFNILDKSIAPANDKYYKSVASILANAAPIDEKRAKLIEAMSDPAKMRAYAKLRTDVVNLKVNADTIGLEFFERRELLPDEVPAYRVEDPRPRVPIISVSTLGGSATMIYSDTSQLAYFGLEYLETPWIKANKYDLLQGIVDRSDKINQDLADAEKDQLDTMAWTAINACFGALGTDTWVLDSKIKNAPTTNDLDLSSACQGRITKALFKGVTEHFDRIGKPIRALYIPAARRHDLYDFVGISASDISSDLIVPAGVAEQVWRSGDISGGLVPPIRFTNVLEGEEDGAIYCYAVTNDAPGYFYQKPFLHETEEKTEGKWYMAKTTLTAGFIIPPYRKQNIARIKIG